MVTFSVSAGSVVVKFTVEGALVGAFVVELFPVTTGSTVVVEFTVDGRLVVVVIFSVNIDSVVVKFTVVVTLLVVVLFTVTTDSVEVTFSVLVVTVVIFPGSVVGLTVVGVLVVLLPSLGLEVVVVVCSVSVTLAMDPLPSLVVTSLLLCKSERRLAKATSSSLLSALCLSNTNVCLFRILLFTGAVS